MDKKELAYAKQTLLTVKDWDAFQHVLRVWAKLLKSPIIHPRVSLKEAGAGTFEIRS